ncbi:hypothetical protein PMAYCL1PPCAC_27859, partial [Pristionchus mayeri]
LTRHVANRTMLLPFALLCVVGAALALCPVGYQQINAGDCFKLFTTQQTFDTAEAQCVLDGGHLASIHSPNEQTALIATLGGVNPLIGMKCTDDTAGHCTWIDGSANDYNNFQGTGPVPMYGQCAFLSSVDALWYSWNCASPIVGFVCRVSWSTQDVVCSGDYKVYNGGCAALKKTAKTQADAELSCVQEGGHLASIHSEADNSFFAQLASDQGITSYIYLGLAWNAAGKAYAWTDGTPNDYNKFANQFPNTYLGDCVQMMLTTDFSLVGQWTNIACSTPLAYACFREGMTSAPAQCPSNFIFTDNGTIYSPNFPVSIPASQTCMYILATDVGTRVAVNFPIFSTDAGSSLSLSYGIDDPPKKMLSISVNPLEWFESDTNIMKMIFTGSGTPSGQGWKAEFITAEDDSLTSTVAPPNHILCTSKTFTPDPFIYIASPDPYPLNSDCVYFIRSKDGRRMMLEFVDLNIETDAIYVYDGPDNTSKLLGKVTGTSTQVLQFSSTGTTLTLEFVTGKNSQGTKWLADVYYL